MPARPAAALRSALISFSAVLASFGATYAVCSLAGAGASPAILSAALALGLMRRPEEPSPRALLVKLVAFPLVALAAGLVGLLFLHAPVAGAIAFCGGIALSIWLRNFGRRAAAVGRAIALPLVTLLVVPVRVEAAGGPAVVALLVLAAGFAAFACTTAASYLALRLGLSEPAPERPPREKREGAMPIAARMALQMLVALALAFATGMLAFREHWAWVVLTAFIVCSGAIGRGDAIYKGLLRLGGAIGGTLAASLAASIVFPNSQAYAAAIFAVLFLGIWLRQINYAYWAACATLVFALLQGAHGAGALELFAMRVAGIFAGALCAIAATWFIYPIRTELLVRRRVADALAAIREVLTGAPGDPEHARRVAELERHAAELHRVAPPVRLHRAVFGEREGGDHPATLIERTHALISQASDPGLDRKRAGAELRELGAALRAKKDDPPSAPSPKA